jgi:hypothetical protein
LKSSYIVFYGGNVLQAGRLRGQYQMMLLDFFIRLILPAAL